MRLTHREWPKVGHGTAKYQLRKKLYLPLLFVILTPYLIYRVFFIHYKNIFSKVYKSIGGCTDLWKYESLCQPIPPQYYTSITTENVRKKQMFLDVFRGYRNWTLDWNGLSLNDVFSSTFTFLLKKSIQNETPIQ